MNAINTLGYHINQLFKLIILMFFLNIILNLFFINFAYSNELENKIIKLECFKIKKRLLALLELYKVENKILTNEKLNINEIMKHYKYNFKCPNGGKYTLTSDGQIKCLICDNIEKVENINKTSETILKKSIDTTLEAKINKYLNIEDIEFLNKPPQVFEKTNQDNTNGNNLTTLENSNTQIIDNKTSEITDESSENIVIDESEIDEIKTENKNTKLDISQVMTKSAKEYHNEAIEHARNGEINKALEKFKKAIELVPDSFIYRYNYALFLAKIENYDQAYVEFQRLLRLNPNNTRVKLMIEKLKKAIANK